MLGFSLKGSWIKVKPAQILPRGYTRRIIINKNQIHLETFRTFGQIYLLNYLLYVACLMRRLLRNLLKLSILMNVLRNRRADVERWMGEVRRGRERLERKLARRRGYTFHFTSLHGCWLLPTGLSKASSKPSFDGDKWKKKKKRGGGGGRREEGCNASGTPYCINFQVQTIETPRVPDSIAGGFVVCDCRA